MRVRATSKEIKPEEQRYEGIEFVEPPEGLMTAPTHRVVGLMDDHESVAGAVDDLAAEGYDRSSVFVMCGHRGAMQLDASGHHHGLYGRIYRFLERALETHEVFVAAGQHLEDGGWMVSVPAHEENRAEISRILRAHDGHYIHYFGLNSFVRLEA